MWLRGWRSSLDEEDQGRSAAQPFFLSATQILMTLPRHSTAHLTALGLVREEREHRTKILSRRVVRIAAAREQNVLPTSPFFMFARMRTSDCMLVALRL
jgi:hypothetical protein